MTANPRRLSAVLVIGTAVMWAPVAARAGEGAADGPPVQTLVQGRATVVVGADGNGATAARFPTTVGGDEVHYAMVVENGCPPQSTPCPPPVHTVTISLNDELVFQSDDKFERERVTVALNPVGGDENRILLAGVGSPGASARVTVLAVRPADVPFGGRSVLPWAVTTALERTVLTVHNVGPAEITFRLVLFQPDGALAGRSTPHVLPSHATANINIASLAAIVNPSWREGAVHVIWVSRLFSRVSTVGSTRQRSLELDDFGPFPISRAELQDVLGEP